jgi:hypothetical protein
MYIFNQFLLHALRQQLGYKRIFVAAKKNPVGPPANLVCASTDQKQFSEQICLLA